MKPKFSLSVLLVIGLSLAALPFVSTHAHAVTVSFSIGSEASSVPSAVLFQNFDGTSNTSIGTVSGGTLNETLSTIPFADSGNYIVADPTVTVTLTQPASYVGFVVGTPDNVNTVQVLDGTTTLTTFSITSLPGLVPPGPGPAGYLNITAGVGEVITQIIETNSPPGIQSPHCCFETDNYAAILATPSPVPLPAALPLFATGIGGLGLLGWRRKRKAQAVV